MRGPVKWGLIRQAGGCWLWRPTSLVCSSSWILQRQCGPQHPHYGASEFPHSPPCWNNPGRRTKENLIIQKRTPNSNIWSLIISKSHLRKCHVIAGLQRNLNNCGALYVHLFAGSGVAACHSACLVETVGFHSACIIGYKHLQQNWLTHTFQLQTK